MRHGTLLMALLSVVTLVPISGHSRDAEPNSDTLACDIGPVTKVYGKTQWLVYSCTDNRTVVIVSAPGNPGMPFYFTFFPKDGKYQLGGEGTGNKDATKAAFDELKAMSEEDISELIRETRASAKAKQ